MATSFTAAFLFNLQNEEQRSWQLGVMKSLPLNILSRIWGRLHALTLPTPLRSPTYHLWTNLFGCNLDEAARPLEEYKNLSEFFVRTLKPGVRPLDAADLVSPVDARVTVVGSVSKDGTLEQIKGMSYSLGEFLGFIPSALASSPTDAAHNAHPSSLHYIVFYLAPGDYHRIHNPVTALYHHRRHFPGHLFPVNPGIASYVPSLFCRNERVVLAGAWRSESEASVTDAGGRFFSMTMVGAYNVGSVKLSYDEALVTNRRRGWRERRREFRKHGGDGMDVRGEMEVGLTDSVDGSAGYVKLYGRAKVEAGEVKAVQHGGAEDVEAREEVNGLRVRKGEEVARFELGSTVVLVFETLMGEQWQWDVHEGDKVKMGQAVGRITQQPTPSPVQP